MKLPALTLHALARVHRLRPHYSAKFYKDDTSTRPVRGVTLWSTSDRAEATKLWHKTIGESHGKGHVTLVVTLEVDQAVSRAKVGHPARHRIGSAERQVDAFPLVSGVSAPVPGETGDGPASANLQPDPPSGHSLSGTGQGVHHQDVPHTTVDLTKLVK